MKRKRKVNRKFVRPTGGLKPGGPVNQLSQYGVRYHQEYVYDQLSYSQLALDNVSPADRGYIEATLKTITNASKAMTLPTISYKDGNPENKKAENIISNGWACTCIDQLGKCYLVSYKGIEVALFYKRQLMTIKLQPGDRFPEKVCQDPEEAWMRLDLFGQSAKKANFVLTTKLEKIMFENKLLKESESSLLEQNNELETTISKMKNSESKKRSRR